jgi:Dolichyl-phosphate-mannose-protein mannosyltransferase
MQQNASVTLLRRHWLICILVAAGLGLRVAAQVAYHPALIYVDSLKYLYGIYPGSEPLGYAVLLKLVLLAGGLGTVALIQHLLGLASAIILYVVLLRRGAAPWLAALAAAPVLLDAYQVQMEQMIMPEALFEVMLVAGIAVLLWRPEVTTRAAIAAGLILGLSATVKQVGVDLFVPAVVYLAISGKSWRRSAVTSGVLVVAFLLPVVGYCGVSYARTGHFWLARRQTVSGRLAAAADCATLRLPAPVRPLCPTPAEQAKGPDFLEHSGQSPLFSTPVKPGTRGQLISELGSAVVRQQPLRVAAAIAHDWLRLFALSRSGSATPISRWQFQTSYPTFPPWVTVNRSSQIVVGLQFALGGPFQHSVLRPAYGGKAQVDRPVAAALRAYQLDGGYTPGPLFALLALLGIGGSVAALVARRRGTAAGSASVAVLLFTVTAAAVLLSADLYEFSWRYQLPALVTLPPAGMLAVSALIARRRNGASAGGAARNVPLRAGDGKAEPERRENLASLPGAGPKTRDQAADQ